MTTYVRAKRPCSVSANSDAAKPLAEKTLGVASTAGAAAPGAFTSEGAQRRIADAYAAYKTNRAHGEYGQTYGFDLRQASAQHFQALKQALRGRDEVLEQHRALGPAPALPADLQDESGLLTGPEATLFTYLLGNLTLKHTTTSLGRMKGQMLALKERERRGEAVSFRSTPLAYHDDDNIFFTIGFQDHPVPKMLLKEFSSLHAITIPLEAAHRQNPRMVRGLWVGPHLTSMVQNQRSVGSMDLMGARFSYAFDNATKTIAYTYDRDGARHVRRVPFAEQILVDGHVGPGVCYGFIEHLRFVGNPYRQHVLDAAARGEASVVAAAMAHLMPGYVNPEAKIPVSVALDPNLHSVAPVPVAYDGRIVDYKALGKTIEEENVKSFAELVHALDWTKCRDAAIYGFLFSQASHHTERDFTPFLEALFKSGAPAFGDDMGTNALDQALNAGAPAALITRLLQHTEPDRRDPAVRVGAPVNDLKVLEQVVARNDQLLTTFFANGTDVRAYAKRLLPHMLAQQATFAPYRKVEMGTNFALLLSMGGGAELEPHIQACLLLFLVSFNDAQAIRKLLRETSIPVDVASPGGHMVRRDEDDDGKRESNAYQTGGTTALMAAVESGALESVEALLDAGANPNARCERGSTPRAIVQRQRQAVLDARSEYEEVCTDLTPEERACDAERIAENFADIEALGQVLDTMEQVLVRYGAVFGAPPTDQELRHNRKDLVHVLVRGVNKQGEPSLLLGIKRNLDGSAHAQRELPGGFKGVHDADNEATAWRYLKGLVNMTDAMRAQLQGALRKVHTFERDGVAPTTHYKHTVYELDLGPALADLPVYAGSDWRAVHQVREASVSRLPVTSSHAAMLNAVQSGEFFVLDKRLTIEHDGYDMLADAAKRGDVALMQALLDAGTPMELEGSAALPIVLAVKSGQLGAVDLLLSREGSRAQEIMSLMCTAIECGDEAITACIAAHVEPTSLAMSGAIIALESDELQVSDALFTLMAQRFVEGPARYYSPYAAPIVLSIRRGLWDTANALVARAQGGDDPYRSLSREDALVEAFELAAKANQGTLAQNVLSLMSGRLQKRARRNHEAEHIEPRTSFEFYT